MYDPSIGRWLEEDPIEFEAGDGNLYRYVGNNPVKRSDPFGLYEVDVHFYMTYYIAAQIGLRDVNKTDYAYLIAWADEYTDHNPRTSPVEGGERARNRYHFRHKTGQKVEACSPEAKGPIMDALQKTKKGSGDAILFGIALHALQDSYSHEGFDLNGHLLDPTKFLDPPKYGSHGPDYPFAAKAKALLMARETFDQLKKFYKELVGVPSTTDWYRDIYKTIKPLLENPGDPEFIKSYDAEYAKNKHDTDVKYPFNHEVWLVETKAHVGKWDKLFADNGFDVRPDSGNAALRAQFLIAAEQIGPAV